MISPHGGSLVSLVLPAERVPDLRAQARDWPSWDLTQRQLCDFELLANGGFSPLAGFLTRRDYDSVLSSMRLDNGSLWPIPVTLGVSAPVARGAERAGRLVLRDDEGGMLGVLQLEDVWEQNRESAAAAVFGTTDRAHAGVDAFLREGGEVCLGGRLEAFGLPTHYDFREHRHTPAELRAEFARRGWTRVAAFQTRNPLHRAHYEMTVRAMRSPDSRDSSPANLLLHPAVGSTKPGDVDHYTRVRCYRALLPRYPDGQAMLSLLPLAMRLAGPREALWHAIIRRNYGCTHFIVGRDHAGPGSDAGGGAFYGHYEAQELVRRFAQELEIGVIPFQNLVYVPEAGEYLAEESAAPGTSVSLSGTELRSRLAAGDDIPDWFTFPEVLAELRRTSVPRPGPGLTVFITGLPAAGKSTVAKALQARLLEEGRGPVALLDGDAVRKRLSPDLGFSKADRDENIRRIGRLACEITGAGGVAICAAIAPYDAVRKEVRRMVESVGAFVLVYVATPLEVCEARDGKGLYAKARAGVLKEFTGISDPYETPDDAEVVIDATTVTASEAADRIARRLLADRE